MDGKKLSKKLPERYHHIIVQERDRFGSEGRINIFIYSIIKMI